MQFRLEFATRPSKEAYAYGDRSDGGTHGLVLTKRHVVELILDLAGYRSDIDLPQLRLLEPACGHGAFLVPTVERLLRAAAGRGIRAADLRHAITAYDVEKEHVDATRAAISAVLETQGVNSRTARALVEGWVHQGDFLLANFTRRFDVVVGNPPYVRIEQLSPELQAEYRRLYATLFDRADLYVAFIERSLALLSPTGVLSFVCADRWTLNRYGAPLRKLLATSFNIRAYIDLHQASPFESEVIAYPSIFVIDREKQSTPVVVAAMATASSGECEATREKLLLPEAI